MANDALVSLHRLVIVEVDDSVGFGAGSPLQLQDLGLFVSFAHGDSIRSTSRRLITLLVMCFVEVVDRSFQLSAVPNDT